MGNAKRNASSPADHNTSIISSVAYADDESASEANTGKANSTGSRSWRTRRVESTGPISSRQILPSI
jgi:hypothetical protein